MSGVIFISDFRFAISDVGASVYFRRLSEPLSHLIIIDSSVPHSSLSSIHHIINSSIHHIISSSFRIPFLIFIFFLLLSFYKGFYQFRFLQQIIPLYNFFDMRCIYPVFIKIRQYFTQILF